MFNSPSLGNEASSIPKAPPPGSIPQPRADGLPTDTVPDWNNIGLFTAGIAVGAIAQSVRQPSRGIDLATRLKAKRHESGVHALFGRARFKRVLGTEVASDLPSGRLHGA